MPIAAMRPPLSVTDSGSARLTLPAKAIVGTGAESGDGVLSPNTRFAIPEPSRRSAANSITPLGWPAALSAGVGTAAPGANPAGSNVPLCRTTSAVAPGEPPFWCGRIVSVPPRACDAPPWPASLPSANSPYAADSVIEPASLHTGCDA
jgi:hypothetical protein